MINYWLWFSSIDFLGSICKLRLLNEYKSPEKIFTLTKEELKRINGIGEKISSKIIESKSFDNLQKLTLKDNFMKNHKIGLISILDNEYPDNLRKIYDPPIVLFYIGNKNLLKKRCIGIVGSRLATSYGIKMSEKISKELSQNEYTVVSGLAHGIDSSAHKGAVNEKMGTIAVIGSGLDFYYPKENYELYKEIAKKGLIISEYIVGTKPLPGNFPARNRIISGLSEAIIVVEASKNSGSLITVDFALEQGKSVYAVPGNINSSKSTGTNELIKDGAIPYTDISDIIFT